MTELLQLLAVFLEKYKNRSRGGKREKRNKIDGVFRLENCFQYLSSNSLKVQSIEPTSVAFFNFSNKLSLDVPVKTRTCRSCNVNISSHLAKHCMC